MSFADTEVPRDPKLTCSPDGITRDDCAVERNQVRVDFRLAQHVNQNPQWTVRGEAHLSPFRTIG